MVEQLTRNEQVRSSTLLVGLPANPMSDFTIQRKDIRRAFSKARVFAVSKHIVKDSNGAFADTAARLSGAGVRTVLFDGAKEVEREGTVFLAFSENDVAAAHGASFFAAPASAPIDVKMVCSYVSSLDGEAAAIEIADLIMAVKKS